ncbi:MAG: stage II sporulation protein P [Clostridia bacterium]
MLNRISRRRKIRFSKGIDGRAVTVVLLFLVAVLFNIYNSAISFFPQELIEGEEKNAEKYIEFEKISIDKNVGNGVKFELLNLKNTTFDPGNLKGSEEPAILIYHTHTTEAYSQAPGCEYKEKFGKWRTNDNKKNIVAVGEALAEKLRALGYKVIHDTTDHEPPKLATAYSRSVLTMEKYKKQYPSIKIFIDVHRDAYSTNSNGTDFCEIDGKRMAKLMFVVGTGEGATGAGFKEMPDFESNFALANKISTELSGYSKSLVRKIRVKTGRYNQHISPMCLLVEVGHNNNTLFEALNSMDYLAKAMNKVFSG